MNAAVPFEVVALDPGRAMVLKVDDAGAPSWVWYLEPLPGGRTRVLERFRQGGTSTLGAKLLQVYLLDPGDPTAPALALYGYLSWLQEQAVEALSSSLP